MKRASKKSFFVVLALILVCAYFVFFGLETTNGDNTVTLIKGGKDIRWGIDIRGGVDVTFTPAGGYDADENELAAAESIIKTRLISNGITDYELYSDTANDRIIVRFPWSTEETEFNPETAVKELGETARLTFRVGLDTNEDGTPSGELIMEGKHIETCEPQVLTDQNTGNVQYVVAFTLNEEGKTLFADATAANVGKVISIWMDDTLISYPTVNEAIPSGEGYIEGNFDRDSVIELSDKINAGALPFSLVTTNYSSISPTVGEGAKDTMITAGVIAFILVCAFIIFRYRLPGVVASIALFGQVTLVVASMTRIFPEFSSFTLTLPGIAGIVLAIGFGVDANVVSAERIKEEIRSGKSIDGSIVQGFKRAFSAILDGNITVIIVAIILMSAFGPPDTILPRLFKFVYLPFSAATTGSIYSFGYTLLMGVVFNLVMGVFASKIMLRSISQLKCFRDPWFYGGEKASDANSEKTAARPLVSSFDFVSKRKIFFIISACLIAATLLGSVIIGTELDIQFKGGSIVSYSYEGSLDLSAVTAEVQNAIGKNVSLQENENFSTGTKGFTVSLSDAEGLAPEQQALINERLQELFPENNIEMLSLNNVAPTIGREFLVKSVYAVCLAAVMLIIFIWLRFRNIGGWSAGIVSIIALFHDIIIVFSVFVFAGIPINDNFIAVILTILGYSLNDTIIIYDRIRENKKLLGSNQKVPIEQLVNLSINQSFTRALNTTITTALALSVIAVMGLMNNMNTITTFAFPMIAGLICGVYSSVCVSGSLWVWWQKKKGRELA